MFPIFVIHLTVLIYSAYCNFSATHDQRIVSNVVQCLTLITKREFDFNPKGFMVITKTFGLSETADEIQNNYIRIVYALQKTAVMIVGNDGEDKQWKLTAQISDTNHPKDDADELGVILTEDLFIQTHLMFIRLSDFYVIVIDSYRMYNSKIRQLIKIPSWNARAPIVIYCSVFPKSEKRMMLYPKNILQSLWTYHALNVVLLVHDWKNHSVINVFSWRPYDPPSRCGEKNQDVSKYITLDDMCIGGQLVKGVTLFPNKVPIDLKGCPIKILGVIWHPFLNHNLSGEDAGFDRNMVDAIADKMNFTLDLNTEESSWGDRAPNGSWDGLMGALKKGKGEVGIGAIYPDNNVHEDFDSTLSYLQDSYAWIVPRARRVPHWENLIITLKPTMWIASGAVYSICTFIWYLLSKPYYETGIKDKEFLPGVLDSLCINLGVSMTTRPNSNSMRIYFVGFCMYSMIWCTIYQTKLITILTTPTYEHQITDIEELLSSKLKIGGNEAFKFLFNNSNDETESHIHSNYIEFDIHEVLEDVIKFRNLSILTSRLYVRHLTGTTSQYNDLHGDPLFYSLHSNVFSFPVEMVAVKGFALLERFNFIITILKSNGLVHHFYTRFDVRSKLMAAKLVRDRENHNYTDQILNLEHLQGAFFILILGILMSTIIFVTELIIQSVNKKRLQSEKRQYLARAKKNIGFNEYSSKHEFIKWCSLHEKQKYRQPVDENKGRLTKFKNLRLNTIFRKHN